MLAVTRKEYLAGYEVNAAADGITDVERRSVLSALPRAAEEVPVIAVVPVRGLVPARQSVRADVFLAKSDAEKSEKTLPKRRKLCTDPFGFSAQ